ncbi:MAG: Fe-S cluster assembly protein HesB [Actinomycetota bacterium]|nr:Fe-S cluster assembly protein HesB [Actinomycetota bacterium]
MKGSDRMLTVSRAAAQAIRRLIDSTELSGSAGIRIAAADPPAGGTALELALVESPQPDDQVVCADEVSVFVEAQLAALLADKMLDAEVAHGEVAFALREPPPSPPPAHGQSVAEGDLD